MKGIWKNSEVKELFNVVEDYKEKNKSLKLAFIAHAQKFGRKPNSVRNYYYHEVDNLKLDEKRLNKLGINLNRHNKSNINYFSKEEEKKLMEEIDSMVKKGVSVRKACLTLSGGDVSQMLRFQNKYRNFLARAKKPEKQNTNLNNVIAFKKQSTTLTDGEVQSLFMGLVRLVKRNALEESESLYKHKLLEAKELLQKASLKLSTRERDYDKLKEEFLKLKNENSALVDLNRQMRCQNAEMLRKKSEEKEK